MNRKQFEDGSVNIVSRCICDECASEITEVIVMEDTLATDETRSNGNTDDMYKTVCTECAWELYESSSGQWQAM